MRSQSLAILKREKTLALAPTVSTELLPPTFSRENRNRSIDTFKDFDNSLSKLHSSSKMSSLQKLKADEVNLLYSKLLPNALKPKQLRAIDDRLKQKLFLDEQIEYAYSKELTNYQNKKGVLQRRLHEIKMRNNARIKQVQDFEDNVVNKYRLQFNRDKLEYYKLSELYNKLSEDEELAALKYSLKLQKANHDRQKIHQQQKRFINFINGLKNESLTHLGNSSLLSKYGLESNQMNPERSGNQKPSKPSNPSRKSIDNRGKDFKQIGDQYLQDNKKMSLKNKKRAPTPVNLKSIDYNPQVKQRLQKNEKTLSSNPIKSQQIKPTKRTFTVSHQAVQNDELDKSTSSKGDSK